MEKFQNKYRIPSARVKWHNYKGGIYFITICTKDRECYFGEIENNENGEAQMNLTELGRYVEEQIKITQQMRVDMNIETPLYVVMPNHIHLIIIIGNNEHNDTSIEGDAKHCVSTSDSQNKFGPQSKNLAAVIRGFKSAVSKFANANNIPFAWQSRFYDHIVRNQEEMNRIATYIEDNVCNWKSDELY